MVLPLALGGALTIGALTMPAEVAAQLLAPEVRHAFLSSPLDDEPLDPLLPNPPVRRPLSPLEQYQLEQDLDDLALLAEALSTGASPPPPFNPGDEFPGPEEIWMREVRLRRLIGIEPELQSIRRVAQWMRDQTATQELQLLAARLEQIQQGLSPDQAADRPRLLALAEIYSILGEVEAAATIHRALAHQARLAGDEQTVQTQLETLANLQAAWFDFEAAAATYGELIDQAQLTARRDDEVKYLKFQSRNLEQAQQFAAAVASQQRLLAIYNEFPVFWPLVPALQHAMAENYLALENRPEAARYFQSAYTNAIDQSQFNIAATSIRSLASLYRSLQQWQDVRYLYEQLTLVERLANNAFGLMEAFDALGQLYEQLEDPAAALAAYREGLVMAQTLSHREAYFEAQIARLEGSI